MSRTTLDTAALAHELRLSVMRFSRRLRNQRVDTSVTLTHLAALSTRAVLDGDQFVVEPVVVGSFEEAIDCWRNYAQRFPNDNDGVILAATSGAVNVRLGGEALKSAYSANGTQAMDDTESTPGREAEVGHLRSIVGLVWRSVVLWMVLLALLTLARLLG